MIQHTVAFRLHDSADKTGFLARAAALASISDVADFEVLRQVGLKNKIFFKYLTLG